MEGAAETPYDLRFRLLRIPVRVHPLFWVVMAALGWQNHELPLVAVWVACGFVSILVHEFGHGLMSRVFGSTPSIVLWAMGGLCYSQAERQSLGQRLAVVLAGPAAGLALYVLVMIASSAIYGLTAAEHLSVTKVLLNLRPSFDDLVSAQRRFPSEISWHAYWSLIQINLFWSLFNLLPIWPLDGGAIMTLAQGSDNFFRALFLGYFAMINYQMLQSLHQAQSMGLSQEDDWWRR
jgi:Zn-dependent protease